ncbi:hypothetical protein [Stenotrophomonas acidaminiphila]|jgi:hypothetical protein
MSAHKHTPEWNVSRLTPSRVDTPDGSISVSWSSNADGGERNRKAENAARLIAAAPELLEALNKLTSFVVTDVVESCNGNKCREPWCAGCFGEEVAEQTIREAQEALDAARAAIAKATGEPA